MKMKFSLDNKVGGRVIRCAIYTRVSTQEQAEEGYSIDEQYRLLEEECIKQGYYLEKHYSDRGISGKDIKHRPALQELLKDAEEGKFDMVISWKINRISRKLADVLKIVDILEKNNITYKSYSEPFETDTPAGRMQFQMMALIGEFERGTISQNVKLGMMAMAKSGNWCGGIVLGYDVTPIVGETTGKRKKTKLTINEEEANVVRFIFQEYASGKGYKAIVNQLNKQGYRTKRGNAFGVYGIKEILKNPVYIGKIRYNVRQNWSEKRRRDINPNPILVDGIHEPIIDMNTWNKVQELLENKQGRAARIYDTEFPLTGILKCPMCGKSMTISRVVKKNADGTKRVLNYYACGAWKNKGTAVCKSNMIRIEKVHEHVYGKLSSVLTNDKMVESIVKNLNRERKQNINPSKKQLERIEKELERLDSKKTKIFEAYEEEIITKEEFIHRREELNKSVSKLQEEKQQYLEVVVDDTNQEVSYELVRSILQNFNNLLENCKSREEKKKLLHLLISEITINEAREIDSIHLSINDSLVDYITKQDGVSIKEASSIFVLKNIGVPMINLRLTI